MPPHPPLPQEDMPALSAEDLAHLAAMMEQALTQERSRLTTTEVSEMLGIPRRRISLWAKEGLIVAEKVGRDYLIAPIELPAIARLHRRRK